MDVSAASQSLEVGGSDSSFESKYEENTRRGSIPPVLPDMLGSLKDTLCLCFKLVLGREGSLRFGL